MSRPLTWLYRKLGRHYPAAFITAELQTAFLVGAGAVALFGFYYEVSTSEFLAILAITEGLTAVALAWVIARVLKRIRPLKAWIGGARSPDETAEAWHVAVNLPMDMIRWDFFVPVIVTVITVIASLVVLGLSWLAFSRSQSPACSQSPMRRPCTTWRSSSECGRSFSTSMTSSRCW